MWNQHIALECAIQILGLLENMTLKKLPIRNVKSIIHRKLGNRIQSNRCRHRESERSYKDGVEEPSLFFHLLEIYRAIVILL